MADNILTQKLGPLAAWQWGAIAGGGILLWKFTLGRGGSDDALPSESEADIAAGAGIVTRTSRAPTNYMPFSAPPDTVALDESRAAAVAEALETLDPRFTSLEDLYAQHQDALDDTREQSDSQLAAYHAYQTSVWEAVNANLTRFAEYTQTALQDLYSRPAVAPAPTVNTTPHENPPAPRVPIPGEHVWRGSNPPNMTTINALLVERYGKVVPTRTTKPGTGGYLVTIA